VLVRIVVDRQVGDELRVEDGNVGQYPLRISPPPVTLAPMLGPPVILVPFGGRLSQDRRDLPWVRVDKQCVLKDRPSRRRCPKLFDGRSQVIVYHFVFGPDWEERWPHLSPWADRLDGIIGHLNQRDMIMVGVSGAVQASSRRSRRACAPLQVGLLIRNQFQFRLPRVVRAARDGQEGSPLQLHSTRSGRIRAGGCERMLQGSDWWRVSHFPLPIPGAAKSLRRRLFGWQPVSTCSPARV
jgi:hypothetical protein